MPPGPVVVTKMPLPASAKVPVAVEVKAAYIVCGSVGAIAIEIRSIEDAGMVSFVATTPVLLNGYTPSPSAPMNHLVESLGSTAMSVIERVSLRVHVEPPSADMYRPGFEQPLPEPGPGNVPGLTIPAKTVAGASGSNTMRLVVQPVMSTPVLAFTQSVPPFADRQIPAP